MMACVACGPNGRVVAASEYSVENDPEVEGDDDRMDAGMVALFLQRPDQRQSGGLIRARWEHLRYCLRCQHAWLDNTSAAPVEVVDVDALLKG